MSSELAHAPERHSHREKPGPGQRHSHKDGEDGAHETRSELVEGYQDLSADNRGRGESREEISGLLNGQEPKGVEG